MKKDRKKQLSGRFKLDGETYQVNLKGSGKDTAEYTITGGNRDFREVGFELSGENDSKLGERMFIKRVVENVIYRVSQESARKEVEEHERMVNQERDRLRKRGSNLEMRIAHLEKSSGYKFSRATQMEILKTFIKLYKGRSVKIEGDASATDFDENDNPIYTHLTIHATFNIEELYRHISPIIQKNEKAKITEKQMVGVLYNSTSRNGVMDALIRVLHKNGLLNPLKIRGFYWEEGSPSNFNPRSWSIPEMEWFLQLNPSQNNPKELEIIIPMVVS